MRDQELEELEGALARATPAPWFVERWDGTLGRSSLRTPLTGPSELRATFDRRGYGNAGSDAAAIAALRNAAPALLAEVREGRTRLDKLHRAICGISSGTQDEWVREKCAAIMWLFEGGASAPRSP